MEYQMMPQAWPEETRKEYLHHPPSNESGAYENSTEYDKLPLIAVIGMSVKFPQSATTVENFWQMLLHGRSAMTEFPEDRLNVNAFYHADASRWGSVSPHQHILIHTGLPRL